MAAVSAPPQPIITCPYTAGGCPLFQTIDVSESSRCAGSCSPAPPPAPAPLRGYSSTTAPSPKPSTSAATPSSLSSVASRPTPGSYSYDDALLLSELTGEIGLPLPSALLKQDSWSGYLDFGISPDQLEVPFLATLSGPSSVPLPAAQPPAVASAPKHQLWDIEELIPPEGAKRVRTTPPPIALPGAATSAVGYPQGDLPVNEPSPAAAPRSPSTSDEENEVVTVRRSSTVARPLKRLSLTHFAEPHSRSSPNCRTCCSTRSTRRGCAGTPPASISSWHTRSRTSCISSSASSATP